MGKRVVFHVGLAKTGTTSFQHDCRRYRNRLARAGVLYPRAMQGLARNHSPLAASYLAHRPHDPTISLKVVARDTAVAAVKAEIEARDCPVALLSSEHFSIHFDRYEAAHLAADFSDYACEIVVALREPYGRFLSMWNTHVTAGGSLSLEDYARTILVPDNRFISIRETLLIWHETFGAKQVHLVDWDACGKGAGADGNAAILRLCGMAEPLPSTPRRRVSLPLGAIERLRLVNAAIAARQTAGISQGGGVAGWTQHSAFSLLARRRLARRDRARDSQDDTPPIVSPQTMAALDLIFAQDRDWLADACGYPLASTRDRLVVGEPPPVTAPRREAAEALLDEVSRGLWPLSQRLVEMYERRRNR